MVKKSLGKAGGHLKRALLGKWGAERKPWHLQLNKDEWKAASEEYWCGGYRRDSRGEVNRPDDYWHSGSAGYSYTSVLLAEIRRLGGGDSFMEIGCNAGRNLYHLALAYPEASIIGLEINPEAVQLAREKVPGATNWDLRIGNLTDPAVLGRFLDNSVDIVFSMAVLIHIVPGPDKQMIIHQCLRIARKAALFIEAHTEDEPIWDDRSDETRSPHCIDNYRNYLPESAQLTRPEGLPREYRAIVVERIER